MVCPRGTRKTSDSRLMMCRAHAVSALRLNTLECLSLRATHRTTRNRNGHFSLSRQSVLTFTAPMTSAWDEEENHTDTVLDSKSSHTTKPLFIDHHNRTCRRFGIVWRAHERCCDVSLDIGTSRYRMNIKVPSENRMRSVVLTLDTICANFGHNLTGVCSAVSSGLTRCLVVPEDYTKSGT